eukprot:700417-Rhodomonas_salina.1
MERLQSLKWSVFNATEYCPGDPLKTPQPNPSTFGDKRLRAPKQVKSTPPRNQMHSTTFLVQTVRRCELLGLNARLAYHPRQARTGMMVWLYAYVDRHARTGVGDRLVLTFEERRSVLSYRSSEARTDDNARCEIKDETAHFWYKSTEIAHFWYKSTEISCRNLRFLVADLWVWCDQAGVCTRCSVQYRSSSLRSRIRRP